MSRSADGPTRGAFEQADDRRWQSSPVGAFLLRSAILVGPIVGAFLGLLLLADVLIHPPGLLGLMLWFLQGVIVGTAISMTLDRLTKALLPLVTLFNLSLVFPDQAPSRFGVALRAGTLRRLKEQATGDQSKLLGEDASAAAVRAVEYITALGRHDRLTRGHTERVRAYADLIAEQMGLTPEERAKLTWGVMLHDIGKITVPAEVLNKEEKLTDEEWGQLKGHPEAGGRMLTPLREWLGPWALAASEHHERFDGGGYPRGLAGRDISLAGRITAVADAYDVITSKRSYKEPMSPAAARRELVVCAGTQFDPDVVRAFLNVSVGRRWSSGVVAALSHLPLGNLGTAPAAVTIGAFVTGGAVIAGVPPPEVPQTLAFDDAPMIVESTDDTATSLATSTLSTSTLSTRRLSTSTLSTTTTSVATPELPSVESTTVPTSTESGVGSTSTSTLTTTTTTNATTAQSTVPPTTTGAPPPTSPPATTTAPTTTDPPTTPPPTTVAPGATLYLKNPNSDGQNSSAQLFKPLESSVPVDGIQYNFDTNRDGDPGIPGLRLLPSSDGFAEGDAERVHRYFYNASDATLSGPISLRLWAATDTNGVNVSINAALFDCNWTGLSDCHTISTASAPQAAGTWVGAGFQELVFDLGQPTQTFAGNRRLVLRVISEGSETAHIAFDSTVHPSRLGLYLS